MKGKMKQIIGGIAVGLAVIMSAGAIGLAGKSLGWFEKTKADVPEPTLDALNFAPTAYGTYAVSLKDYEATEVVVPAEYEGKPVTEVAGSDAMQVITYLLGLTGGEGQEETRMIDRVIEDFINSGGFSSVAYIGEVGFAMAPKLAKVTLPDSIKVISEGAFYACAALTEIVIPDGVTMIKDFAFQWCYSLKSVEIPDSVTELGNDVFYYNYDLVSAKLPEHLEKCGERTFFSCKSLTEVNIPILETLPVYMFHGCKALEHVTIPDGVKTISKSVFSGCAGLKELVLPNTLEAIENDSFLSCKALATIYNLSKLVLEKGSLEYGRIAEYATNIYTELPAETESKEN